MTRSNQINRLWRSIILSVLTALLVSQISAAQQNRFPEWMNEVSFSSSASEKSIGFNEPQAPIDPSTGSPVPDITRKNSAFGKPRLPDFKKMREKALKAELQQRAQDNDSLEQGFNASLKNRESLLKTKSELEALLAGNPAQAETNTLLQALGDTEQKIRLIGELSSILESGDEASVGNVIASLTPEKFKRAMQIRQQLFPGKPAKASEIRQPKSLFADQDAKNIPQKKIPVDDDISTPRKKYRPGKIKSIYLESREARKKAAEYDNEN